MLFDGSCRKTLSGQVTRRLTARDKTSPDFINILCVPEKRVNGALIFFPEGAALRT